jgi:Tfp pilus assembly protein PilF
MAQDYVKSAVRLHRAEPAETVLTAAVERAPSASLLVARALLYWNTNRPDLALQSLQSASRLDPKEVSAYLLGAEIQSAAGNLQAMRELVARALAVNPQNPEAIGLAAEAELKDGRFEPASRLAEGALRVDPRESRALEVQALALAQLGRQAEARNSFHRLLAASPDAATSRNNFGVFELQQGNPSAAARLFKDAVDLDPTNLNGYRGLKEAALLLNQTDLIQFAERGVARLSR